jgi:hypothetical protein
MAAHFFDRFSAAIRAMAARCKLSFALRPELSQKIEIAPRKLPIKEQKKTKERTKESCPRPLLLFRSRHEGGRGEEQRFLNLGPQLLAIGWDGRHSYGM